MISYFKGIYRKVKFVDRKFLGTFDTDPDKIWNATGYNKANKIILNNCAVCNNFSSNRKILNKNKVLIYSFLFRNKSMYAQLRMEMLQYLYTHNVCDTIS